MKIKCEKHYLAIPLRYSEWKDMDDTFYELGSSDDCVTCQREREEEAARRENEANTIYASRITFLLSDLPTKEQKQAVMDIFTDSVLDS